MVEEYKVIKPFDTLKVGDVLVYNSESNVYEFYDSLDMEGYSSLHSIMFNSKLAEDYAKSGLLEPIIEETKLEEKFNKLTNLIANLKNTYTQRNDSMDKRFKEGKIQACVKTEHDTVHFNLMKLLNKFEEIINE